MSEETSFERRAVVGASVGLITLGTGVAGLGFFTSKGSEEDNGCITTLVEGGEKDVIVGSPVFVDKSDDAVLEVAIVRDYVDSGEVNTIRVLDSNSDVVGSMTPGETMQGYGEEYVTFYQKLGGTPTHGTYTIEALSSSGDVVDTRKFRMSCPEEITN
jgi:hypothetical protein